MVWVVGVAWADWVHHNGHVRAGEPVTGACFS
jgi:hypothetical protein